MNNLNKLVKSINARSLSNLSINYVPNHKPINQAQIASLVKFLEYSKKLLILTGAGISTESGIPDYRSEGVGLYARKNHKPVESHEFLKSSHVRRRYWSRNYVAWPTFSQIQPNRIHYTVKDLEVIDKKCIGVITQNVDYLHHKAGSKNIIELHGNGYLVKCLNCNYSIDRHHFQKVLDEANPHFYHEIPKMLRPDGDIEISQEQENSFILPDCPKCGGILKTNIVFFGDNVPRERVQKVDELISECDALLVLGSSLTVYSSYRIALAINEYNKYIAIVNIGATRADYCADLKISAKCGELLPIAHEKLKG